MINAEKISLIHFEENPEKLYLQGVSLYEQKDVTNAIIALSKCIFISPAFAIAYIKRGEILLGMSNFNGALNDFKIAYTYMPNDYNLNFLMGYTYHGMSNWNDAIVFYDEAIKIKAEINTLLLRGEAYRKLSNFSEALKNYEEVLRINPLQEEAYVNRGYIYYHQNDKELAKRDFEYILENVNKESYIAHANLASVFMSTNNYAEAIPHYLFAIDSGFKPENVLVGLGYAYDKIGQDDAALRAFSAIYSELPNSRHTTEYFIRSYELFNLSVEQLRQNYDYFFSLVCWLKQNHLEGNFFELTKRVISFWLGQRYIDLDLENRPKYLYQYTSTAVLEKIIRTNQLRLTPVEYLNDPFEGKALYEYIARIAEENCDIEKALNIIKTNNPDTSPKVFIRSLSALEDSLIMWDSSYADYANGVAIGINPSVICSESGSGIPVLHLDKQEVNNSSTLIPIKNLELYKISYINIDKEPDERLESIINLVIQILKHELPKFKAELLAEAIIRILTPITHLIKYDSYEHEKEYRLLYIVPNQILNELPFIKSNCIEGLYIQTEPALFKQVDSENVILGPKQNIKTSLKITAAIKHMYPNVNVASSNIKFT